MDAGSVALAIVAAVWARENARSSGFERLNRIRDNILLGQVDGNAISLTHRRLIYEADWLPLARGAVVVSLLFAFVVGTIPFMVTTQAGEKHTLIALCAVVAAYNVLSSALTARTFFADAKHLQESLAESGSVEQT